MQQLVEVPKTVSQDRIQQRNVEQIVDVPVPEVFKVSSHVKTTPRKSIFAVRITTSNLRTGQKVNKFGALTTSEFGTQSDKPNHILNVSDLFDFSIHFFSFLISSLITLLFLLPDTFNFHDVVDKYPSYFL